MSVEAPESTYDPAYFAELFAIEDRHAWFRARRELIGEIVAERVQAAPDGYRVLEVGCGTGSVLQTLDSVCHRGQVVGMDTFSEGLRFARTRTDCELVVGDANRPPFGREFTLVGMFDVLEHLSDDEGVLRRMSELLLPGGTLLLTVPADPALWSYYDEAAHHVRRYALADLEVKLEGAGFVVDYLTYFMGPLALAIRAYRRLLPQLGGTRRSSVEHQVIPVANEIFYRILKAEHAQIRKRRRLSRGTSLLAIARWPAS